MDQAKNKGAFHFFLSLCFLVFITLAVSSAVIKDLISVAYVPLILSVLLALLIAFLLSRTHTFSVSHPYWSAIFIIAAAAIPRIVFVMLVKTVPAGDFFVYNKLANGIATGTLFTDPTIPLRYASIFPHTVAYPSFLSIFIHATHNSAISAHFLSIVCYSISALLVGKIADNIYKGNFLSGGLVFALFPSQIYYSALMATESLFLMLMLLAVTLFLQFIKRSPLSRGSAEISLMIFFFAIFLALTNAVRPMAPVLLISSVLFLFMQGFLGVPHRFLKRFACLLAILVLYSAASQVLSFGVSKLINREIAASPVGFNLYVGMNTASRGRWSESDSKQFAKLAANYSLSPQQIHDTFLKMGISRALTQRDKLPELAAQKFRIMWKDDSESVRYIKRAVNKKTSVLALGKSETYLTQAANTYYLAILFLVLFHAFQGVFRKKRAYAEIYPMLIILGIAAVHLIVEVAGRYHAPALPMLTILALPYSYNRLKQKGAVR